ncbi:hypothetical protein [Jeongeupia sp. HS-3]|nr:hypothetical protein [Jeongeupia sp. HS-3]
MRKPARNAALLTRATRDRITAAIAGLSRTRSTRPQRAAARRPRY